MIRLLKSQVTDFLESQGARIHGGEILGLVSNQDYDSIEYLENKKFPLNWNYTSRGLTPLMVAVQNNDPQLVKYVLKKGANKNFQNKEGKRAIDFAEDNKEGTEIRELLK